MNIRDLEKAIELLENMNAEMKAEHMAKDMVEGVTAEEIERYRENYRLINIAVEVLEQKFVEVIRNAW